MFILKIILAILLPPVAAYLQVKISTHFWVNIILTILGGVPGMIHALWLVLTNKNQLNYFVKSGIADFALITTTT